MSFYCNAIMNEWIGGWVDRQTEQSPVGLQDVNDPDVQKKSLPLTVDSWNSTHPGKGEKVISQSTHLNPVVAEIQTSDPLMTSMLLLTLRWGFESQVSRGPLLATSVLHVQL